MYYFFWYIDEFIWKKYIWGESVSTWEWDMNVGWLCLVVVIDGGCSFPCSFSVCHYWEHTLVIGLYDYVVCWEKNLWSWLDVCQDNGFGIQIMKESHGLVSFVSKVGFCLSPKLLFQKLLRMWCCLTCVVMFMK